jgi:transcription initiation factor TFIID TATA-box-binding protein
MKIRIENVVASTSLGDELDLQKIALSLDRAEYEPEQFPGLIYRLPNPKTAILLFRSGKVVCTGGKSMNQVIESIRTVSGLVRKAGQKILERPKITVQNIVATSDLGSEINLNSIAVTLGLDRVEYEPEQFPGLVCRLEDPRVVVLLFGSGRMVCTGARKPADLEAAVRKITDELQAAGLLRMERATAPSQSEPSLRDSQHRAATDAPRRKRNAVPTKLSASPEPLLA